MKSILEMEAGRVYLLQSSATANSVYFETDQIAQLFFRYCDYYLKDYFDVHEYCLTQDGWVMLVKVKSAKTIRKHYAVVESKRKIHTKSVKQNKPKALWQILSERVRLFISTYVRMSNDELGRRGTLVRRKFSRFLCSDMETASAYVEKLRNRQVNLQQPKLKYRGFEEHFRMTVGEIGLKLQSSMWVSGICSVEIGKVVKEVFGIEMPVFNSLGRMVVLNKKSSRQTVKNSIFKPPKS